MAGAFASLELELIFALLAEPAHLETPVRDVAERTGISIGKISALLNELIEHAYLGQRKTAGRRRLLVLQQPKRLLERWEFGNLEVILPRLSPSTWQLRPSTVLGHTVHDVDALERVLIGGGDAADAITEFLEPATLTLRVPPRSDPSVIVTRHQAAPAPTPTGQKARERRRTQASATTMDAG